ncbi:MAG TPA: HD domain-containing protein [Oscillospiraceae bacterium]|nr:HD domain-containing protein [Oscillospiraceae bacterium]HPF55494.1 HD domain-containing protein [Clostridiales bacterium]HPK34784.1 HD domain-containing protein [Oscillospiraceae bacterium]HPR76116.1 HD domain-containing protein [Oscillospiraceae bacterium]
MEYNALTARYKALKEKVTERKEAFERLMEFVEQETAFLTAPASMRFHMSKDCGLLEHSVNVAETLLKIKAVLAPELSDESCVIVALLHDLGKAGIPGQPQYLENEPTEKQKRYGYGPSVPYRFNNDLTYLSVPVRSIWLALPYLPLTQEETQAIVYHDGQYVEDNRSVAKHEKPLTLLLQYADNWCGFVTETEQETE